MAMTKIEASFDDLRKQMLQVEAELNCAYSKLEGLENFTTPDGMEYDLTCSEVVLQLLRERLPVTEREHALLEGVEQLQVQLAGCGVAALGSGGECKQGDYGWSPAFADVMKLRADYEALVADLESTLVTTQRRRAAVGK